MIEVDEINHISSWHSKGLIGVNGINETIGISWEDCVLMQCTWLCDKYGQDIYEWDIVQVKCYISDKWSIDKLYSVSFKRGMFGIDIDPYLHIPLVETEKGGNKAYIPHYGEIFTSYEPTVKVVGNIYDDPDLIDASFTKKY